MLPHGDGSDFQVLRIGLFSYLVHSLGASISLGDRTLMGAPRVMVTLMVSPFPSTPAWCVDLIWVE